MNFISQRNKCTITARYSIGLVRAYRRNTGIAIGLGIFFVVLNFKRSVVFRMNSGIPV
jgi:hypothetical protein